MGFMENHLVFFNVTKRWKFTFPASVSARVEDEVFQLNIYARCTCAGLPRVSVLCGFVMLNTKDLCR